MEQEARYYQDKVMGIGAVQSLIDGVAFYSANKVVQGVTKSMSGKVTLTDTLIFSVGDFVLRQTPWVGPTKEGNAITKRIQWQMNGVIAITFLITNTVINAIEGKDLGVALEKNLIKAAVGFGGNIVVDGLIRSPYY